MVTRADVLADDSTWELSLPKLIGKRVKDIHGYVSMINDDGVPLFKLTWIVFDDGSVLGVEGDYDFPYVYNNPRKPQPNMDANTLARLKEEGEE